MSRHREISADGRDRESESEREVRPAREAFRVAVEEHPAERDRSELEAKPVEHRRRQKEQKAGDENGERRLAQRHRTRGQLARARSRIPRIDLPVGNTVESHRRKARARERHDHPDDLLKRDWRDITRQRDAHQRERKSENGVRQLHEVRVADEHARTAEVLALPARRSSHQTFPNFVTTAASEAAADPRSADILLSCAVTSRWRSVASETSCVAFAVLSATCITSTEAACSCATSTCCCCDAATTDEASSSVRWASSSMPRNTVIALCVTFSASPTERSMCSI